MKSISILVYLDSGARTGRRVLSSLKTNCNKKKIKFKVYKTEYKNHAKTLIKTVIEESKKKEKDRIVIIGGDGTLNECMLTLSKLKEKIPISYISAGTGNDFSRALNLTEDCNRFINNLFEVDKKEVEFLKIKDREENNYVAMNGVGIGFDAMIAHMTNESKKKKLLSKFNLSLLTYKLKIISAYMNRKLFNAKIVEDDKKEKYHKNILFVSFMKNPYFGGGIKIVPTAKNDDGKISLVIAKNVNVIDLIRLIPHVLKTGKHFGKTEKLTLNTAKKFKIEIEGSSYMQTDGEINVIENSSLEINISKYPFYIVEK